MTRSTLPAWNALAVAAGVGMIALCAGTITDVDVFWHVEVGAYTLDGRGFPHPDPWAFTLPNERWHSTAWLSELVLAAVQRGLGWSGVVVLRLVMTVAIAVALARLLLRHQRSWAAPAVYTFVVIPLVGYVQERPQTLSLLFVIWLSARLRDLLIDGRAPRRLTFVGMTYVWACFHGLFVLAPGVLLLAVLGQVLDERRGAWTRLRPVVVTAVLATVVAGLTPMGPRLLLAPFTVSAAASGFIAEWRPTTLRADLAWGFFLMLLLLVVAWSRSTTRVPRAEVFVAVALAAFGLLYVRNAGLCSILLAPLVVQRMSQTWDVRSTLTLPRRPLLALGTLGLAASLLSYARYPALPIDRPAALSAVLMAQPQPLRVLNDYNISGYLISSTRGRVRLTVDGRADRYGSAFLDGYGKMRDGRPGWQARVLELDADVAVLNTSSVLDDLLVTELGWRQVTIDHGYVLLAAPTTVLRPG